jgi:hypothetical protein
VIKRELDVQRDIALFEVDSDVSSLGVIPIPIPRHELEYVSAGVAVELAGYGLREDQQADELRFLVESITSSTPENITVSGFGRSGACEGDSGGPLLMRSESGELIVVATLSRGSVLCTQTDIYSRVDPSEVHAWIESVTADAGAPPPDATGYDCGSISEQGRCLYGSALWCDDGLLAAEACAPNTCGWSASAEAFRCVAPSAPCAGVDAIGECRDNNALRCINARLERAICDACSPCRVDARTGVPACN